METGILKLATESVTGLGFGLIAFILLWRFANNSIKTFAEELRIERKAHREDIRLLADSMKASIRELCDSQSEAFTQQTKMLESELEKYHSCIMDMLGAGRD